MWLFHTFVQFVIALAGVATITTPIARATAMSATSFRLRTNRISVLPRSLYLEPDAGETDDLPSAGGSNARQKTPAVHRQGTGRIYHEFVSQLTPQQEPEFLRRMEQRGYPRDYEPIHPQSRWRELGKKLWVPIAGLGYLIFKFKAVVARGLQVQDLRHIG